MGNFYSSVEDQNKARSDIIEDINRVGNDLTHTYSTKYLDPDFCNQVTMISNDDLTQFQNHVVNNKSYSFGYIGDVPETKESICKNINTEYTEKRALVQIILASFQDCSARIDSIAKGPLCRTNPDLLDRSKCMQAKGQWLEQVVPPDQAVAENAQWYAALNDFHKNFMTQLTVLKDILDDLQQHDTRFSLDRIKEMTNTVVRVKKELSTTCKSLQHHILTIQTFTPAEIAQQNKTKLERQQHSNAARAVLIGPKN